MKKKGPLFVVIAVPSVTLIDQWIEQLAIWDFESLTNKDNKNWKKDIQNELDLIKYKKSMS